MDNIISLIAYVIKFYCIFSLKNNHISYITFKRNVLQQLLANIYCKIRYNRTITSHKKIFHGPPTKSFSMKGFEISGQLMFLNLLIIIIYFFFLPIVVICTLSAVHFIIVNIILFVDYVTIRTFFSVRISKPLNATKIRKLCLPFFSIAQIDQQKIWRVCQILPLKERTNQNLMTR